jgi:hypothetical protein
MSDRLVYNFALLRAVPHVYLGTFHNVGVVVHSPVAEYLGIRVIRDAAELAQRVPGADADLLARYLSACQAVCEGDRSAGPIALSSISERFHWITSPRSDVLQSSPVHVGMGDPRAALDELFGSFVRD